MREPGKPREGWRAFHAARVRERDELELLDATAPWWEREQIRERLGVIKWELSIAEAHMVVAPEYGDIEEVPW